MTKTDKTIIDGTKIIDLKQFPAMLGWELNRRYRTDFKLQLDRDVRRAYTLDVLAFAEYEGQSLGSVDAANNVLIRWQNVEAVFNAVLEFNEVDLELAEEKARWFEFAGEELAASFIAAATSLMQPMLGYMAAQQQAAKDAT